MNQRIIEGIIGSSLALIATAVIYKGGYNRGFNKGLNRGIELIQEKEKIALSSRNNFSILISAEWFRRAVDSHENDSYHFMPHSANPKLIEILVDKNAGEALYSESSSEKRCLLKGFYSLGAADAYKSLLENLR